MGLWGVTLWLSDYLVLAALPVLFILSYLLRLSSDVFMVMWLSSGLLQLLIGWLAERQLTQLTVFEITTVMHPAQVEDYLTRKLMHKGASEHKAREAVKRIVENIRGKRSD